MKNVNSLNVSILLITNIIFGCLSYNYFDHEQYGYWYFAKIFSESYEFSDISRSPLYIVYLNLFNYLEFPYNMLSDSIVSNFVATISLYFLFKERLESKFLIVILILSIGFLYNSIPYTQSLAFGIANFALFFRIKGGDKNFIISYILIISSIFFRNTYIIIFLVFIFFDICKIFFFSDAAKIKKLSILALSIIVLFLSTLYFESKIAVSKYNNGYFNINTWSPTKSKSNTDIAFLLNYNYLFIEKNSETLEESQKDFFYTNKIVFNDAQTLSEAVLNNHNFFVWGLLKNLTHIPPIIINKFTLRNFFPECKNGHSCITNYVFILLGSCYVFFFLLKYFLEDYFITKNYQRMIKDDFLIYGFGNLCLIMITALAMPKMRYMIPFLYFLIPITISSYYYFKKKIQKKYLLNIFTFILIYLFSFSQMNHIAFSNFYKIIKNKTHFKIFENYSNDIEKITKELENCETILVNTPTLIVSFTNYNEKNVKTFFEIPPFGKYSKTGLNMTEEMFINCILFDESLAKSKGQNRGTGPNYNLRRQNYLFPFIDFNQELLIKKVKFNNLGELFIYKN